MHILENRMEVMLKKWCEVLTIVSGKNQKTVVSTDGRFPIYGSGGIIGYASSYLCEAGTTIIGRKGTINKPIYVNQKFWNIDTAFGISPGKRLDSKYLYFFCCSFNFQALDKSTTIPSLSKKDLLQVQMPVPSLEEQKRIVAKIEERISTLDASVAELQTAKEKLKVYRQAVLKEAFDSVQGNSKRVTIKSVCETIKVGIVIKPTQYYVEQGGVFAFRNANVRRNYIEDKDWVMISQEGHQKNLKSQVHKGDVLIARSGVNLGMAAAVPQKYDGYNAIDVVIAVPKEEFILPQYLAQYTNSPHGLEIVRKNQHGAAQGHLNVKEYGNLPIFLPNISKQYSLLEKIESRLSVCDSIEQAIDTSLQQADALRQSILKHAFEGTLV